jgi:hypothetical protein
MRMSCVTISGLVALSASGIARAGTITNLPAVPQPSQSGDLVGFIIQNAGPTAISSRVVTFGQVFAQGAVKPGTTLQARDSDATRRAQIDPLSLYPDGSVRLGAISTRIPPLAAGGQISGVLTTTTTGLATPVNLTKMAPSLSAKITLHQGSSSVTQVIDLGAALQKSLVGSPDYWLRGPVATQARVDVPVSGSLHVTADITGYFDGNVAADVQFNNDIAMSKSGGPVSVDATVTLAGKATSYSGVLQQQYQDWHILASTHASATINVQHDVHAMEKVGAILSYDLGTGIDTSLLQSYVDLSHQTKFGTPLAANGIVQYMPTTGDRPDLGYTTQWNTAWLVTQDHRAATVALAQGDTGGAVPWNLKLANGHWLTPADYQNIWTDPRGGPGSYTTGLTQQIDWNFGWTPDPAHQPDLAIVPYLMTGSRWYHDRMNAQAAFSLSFDYPGNRCQAKTCDIMTSAGDQVRSAAWSSREVQAAATFAKTGTFESNYFAQVMADNWAYQIAQQPSLNVAEGTAAGWLPGAYGSDGRTAEWEQDYMTGVAILAAERGDTGASKFVAWQHNWVIGRFMGSGMNPHDGCTYNLQVAHPSNNVDYSSWPAIESATVAAGLSNGNGWSQSDGDYCGLARAVLGALLTLNARDSEAQSALQWLQGSGAPYIDQTTFQSDPTYNVVPLK